MKSISLAQLLKNAEIPEETYKKLPKVFNLRLTPSAVKADRVETDTIKLWQSYFGGSLQTIEVVTNSKDIVLKLLRLPPHEQYSLTVTMLVELSLHGSNNCISVETDGGTILATIVQSEKDSEFPVLHLA